MANLPLIAWADVPEGHYVFWRVKSKTEAEWHMGRKYGRKLVTPGNIFDVCQIATLQFARAEQQPGEWAAERAELRERDRVISSQLEKRSQGRDDLTQDLYRQINAHLEAEQRLRDGLAALEQEMRRMERVSGRAVTEHPLSDRTQADARFNTYAGAWADRLAALREGR